MYIITIIHKNKYNYTIASVKYLYTNNIMNYSYIFSTDQLHWNTLS